MKCEKHHTPARDKKPQLLLGRGVQRPVRIGGQQPHSIADVGLPDGTSATTATCYVPDLDVDVPQGPDWPK